MLQTQCEFYVYLGSKTHCLLLCSAPRQPLLAGHPSHGRRRTILRSNAARARTRGSSRWRTSRDSKPCCTFHREANSSLLQSIPGWLTDTAFPYHAL